MLLTYEQTPYNGAYMDVKDWTGDSELFRQQLQPILEEIEQKGLLLVWMNIPIARATMVPVAVEAGFTYHHADSDNLTLIRRMVENAFVPGYATHYIGAGGVVIDEDKRILVIQEKYHTVKHYKLPGGTLDPGEHISTAVCREVREETGVETEFISLNTFRHWHGYHFGKSDIYFVCRLKPLSHAITIDDSEIHKAVWMPVQEYLDNPDTHVFNRRIVENVLNTEGLKRISIEGYKDDISHELMFG